MIRYTVNIRSRIIHPFLIIVILSGVCCFYNCAGVWSHLTKPPAYHLLDKFQESELPWTICGKSVEERELYLLELGDGDHCTVIFGAFHGSEPQSAELAYKFAEYLYDIRSELTAKVIIVPIVNPDGLKRGTRVNANGVDLNRNYPTENWNPHSTKRSQNPGASPASEPETKAIIYILETYKPDRIISIHTPLRVINFDGPASELAQRMSQFNHYPVTGDIGYPTPGSFGTYAGIEQKIPTITLELPRQPLYKIWSDNKAALLEAITY